MTGGVVDGGSCEQESRKQNSKQMCKGCLWAPFLAVAIAIKGTLL